VLPFVVAEAAPSTGERQAKGFRKPHSQTAVAAIPQPNH
jgi:hypothetical protein